MTAPQGESADSDLGKKGFDILVTLTVFFTYKNSGLAIERELEANVD